MERKATFTKTKVIATIGPASESVETLVDMINAGMDVARLNLSHDVHEKQKLRIENIRKAETIANHATAIMVDLCGPKIRTGEMEKGVVVKKGQKITITTDEIVGTQERISTIYKNLPKDVKYGDIILIDDGLIQLKVLSSDGEEVTCEVVDGGPLKSKKGMNLPGVKVSVSSITEKDRADVVFAVENDVDFIALSFVRNRDDIKELKWILRDRGKQIPIIAKVEKPEAVDDIDGIIQEADVIMVARGDLGVEVKTEEVPIFQKMIIAKCNEENKPVITATQMLESMIKNPRPTRAEASDIANAVYDGTDAVMLSAETSVGDYPVQAVDIMDTIAHKVENLGNSLQRIYRRREKAMTDAENICRAACLLAQETEASAIITITQSGKTAQMLSKYRPHVPIIAFTQNKWATRYLNMVWGVEGELISEVGDTDSTLRKARELAIELGYVKRGDKVVYATGIPLLESSNTNMLKVEDI